MVCAGDGHPSASKQQLVDRGHVHVLANRLRPRAVRSPDKDIRKAGRCVIVLCPDDRRVPGHSHAPAEQVFSSPVNAADIALRHPNFSEAEEGGAAVSVTQNGAHILPGYAGPPVSSMEITVNSYAALWEMIHNDYGGRLVDVLKIETA